MAKMRKRKYPKLSKAMEVLQIIADEVGFVTSRDPRMMRFAFGGSAEYRKWMEWKAWKRERRRIYYLKRRRLIETKLLGERMMIRFTEPGTRQFLRDRLMSVREKCPYGDCLVVFDVPEIERRNRDLFRRFLRDCEFKMLQKSIWITDKDVSRLLTAFVQQNRLTPWIHIFVGRVQTPQRGLSLLRRSWKK